MLNLKWTLTAGLLAAAFAGIAPQASAQQFENYRGTFQPNFEARFGNVVLAAVQLHRLRPWMDRKESAFQAINVTLRFSPLTTTSSRKRQNPR